jgi:hypothetical protein
MVRILPKHSTLENNANTLPRCTRHSSSTQAAGAKGLAGIVPVDAGRKCWRGMAEGWTLSSHRTAVGQAPSFGAYRFSLESFPWQSVGVTSRLYRQHICTGTVGSITAALAGWEHPPAIYALRKCNAKTNVVKGHAAQLEPGCAQDPPLKSAVLHWDLLESI